MIEYLILLVLILLLLVLLAALAVLGNWLMGPVSKLPFGRGFMERQREAKRRNLELILGLFAKYPVVTNMIIREELGLDRRTVVNHMDELEKLGKVRQIGKTGVDAHYKKVG